MRCYHFDRVREFDLGKVYWSNAYHFTVSRNILTFRNNQLNIFAGFIFLDYLDYGLIVNRNSNGDVLDLALLYEDIFNTLFSSFGLEYSNPISKRLGIGIRANFFFDFIGFGRTDINAFIRWNFLKKADVHK